MLLSLLRRPPLLLLSPLPPYPYQSSTLYIDISLSLSLFFKKNKRKKKKKKRKKKASNWKKKETTQKKSKKKQRRNFFGLNESPFRAPSSPMVGQSFWEGVFGFCVVWEFFGDFIFPKRILFVVLVVFSFLFCFLFTNNKKNGHIGGPRRRRNGKERREKKRKRKYEGDGDYCGECPCFFFL